MYPGQLLVFCISVGMILLGALLCLYSIYDRTKGAEEQARRIAAEIGKRQAAREYITSSPIPLADLNDIIRSINEIRNPFLQVGMYLTVFGIIVMVVSIFIPF